MNAEAFLILIALKDEANRVAMNARAATERERHLASIRASDNNQAHTTHMRALKERHRTLRTNVMSALKSIDDLCSRPVNDVTPAHMQDLAMYADQMRTALEQGQ